MKRCCYVLLEYRMHISIHVSTVTRIARSICKDISQTAVPQAVHSIASMGCGENHNTERDLTKWCANLHGNNLEPYMLHLDMLKPDQGMLLAALFLKIWHGMLIWKPCFNPL